MITAVVARTFEEEVAGLGFQLKELLLGRQDSFAWFTSGEEDEHRSFDPRCSCGR